MRFIHVLMALAVLPFLTISLSAATVGFAGDFAPGNFTLVTNSGAGSVNTSGAPSTIILTGSNDSGTGGSIDTDYRLIVPGSAATVLKFDWAYTSTDDPGFDTGSFLQLAGSSVFLSNTNGQSGTVSVLANPGDVFGFRVNTGDDGFGPGVLTISGFSASAAPAVPTGKWFSETYRLPGGAVIETLAAADLAISSGDLQGSGIVDSVNYLNNAGDGGNFGGDVNPFGIPLDSDDFTVKSTGFLQITQAGDYQFRNNTDDGSRLRIDLNGNGVFDADETVILDDVLSGPHNADSAIHSLVAGQYMIEHVWFEAGGGAEGEVAVSFNGGAFQLFGNPQSDGFGAFIESGIFVSDILIVIPEPATAGLAMMGLVGLALRRRRVA